MWICEGAGRRGWDENKDLGKHVSSAPSFGLYLRLKFQFLIENVHIWGPTYNIGLCYEFCNFFYKSSGNHQKLQTRHLDFQLLTDYFMNLEFRKMWQSWPRAERKSRNWSRFCSRASRKSRTRSEPTRTISQNSMNCSRNFNRFRNVCQFISFLLVQMIEEKKKYEQQLESFEEKNSAQSDSVKAVSGYF